MALLLWAGCLLQAAADQPPVIREPNLSLEIPMPKGYRPSMHGDQRLDRSVGPESWAIVSFKYRLNKDPLPYNPAGPQLQDVLDRSGVSRESMRSFNTASWGEYQVGVIEYRLPMNNLDVVGTTVLIPIDRQSVALFVETPVTFKTEMKHDLNWLLSRTKGPSNWPTAEQLKRAGWARSVEWAAAGLFALYLASWAVFFRGDVLRAHLLRSIWLCLIAVLLFIPLTFKPDIDLYGAFLHLFAPLAILMFVGRRIKLAIDLG